MTSNFEAPNFTQTPNVFFEQMMATMGDAELRVVLVAIRKTFGYHKTHDAISLTQFQRMSGLSRQGVLDGIEAAKEHGLLRELDERGTRGVKSYALVVSDDQSTQETSTGQASRLDNASTGQASRHTKESLLKKEKESARSISQKPYDDVSKRERIEIIKAWYDSLSVKPSSWDTEANHSTAADIYRDGYRAPHVTRYVKTQMNDGYWIGKPLRLQKVAELMPAWIAAHAPVTTINRSISYDLPEGVTGFGLTQFVPVKAGDGHE